MKNFLRFMTLNAVVAACALSASAQVGTAQPTASPDPAAAAKAACTDLYTKWRENYNKPDAALQKSAYEVGKQFVTQCPNDEYISYVQKWIPKYEAAAQGVQLDKQYRDAVTAKDWKNVIASGKQLTAKDQENLPIFVMMAYAGSQSRDKALYPDSLSAARRALQLVESGKADAFTPEQWKNLGFANRNELAAWLNYTQGFFNFDTAPAEAATQLVKALQAEGPLKKDPSTYYLLSLAYQKAEYAPQAQDYQANCAGKDLTDECKMKLDKLNLVVDRVIDAHARAVALTTDATKKAELMGQLEGFYKFRNNDQTTGLDTLINNVQSKPLLLPSAQTMPTPTPSATPATSTTPSGAAVSNPGSTTTTTPANTTTPSGAAKPATTNTNTTTTAKPADGTATKPKP